MSDVYPVDVERQRTGVRLKTKHHVDFIPHVGDLIWSQEQKLDGVRIVAYTNGELIGETVDLYEGVASFTVRPTAGVDDVTQATVFSVAVCWRSWRAHEEADSERLTTLDSPLK